MKIDNSDIRLVNPTVSPKPEEFSYFFKPDDVMCPVASTVGQSSFCVTKYASVAELFSDNNK